MSKHSSGPWYWNVNAADYLELRTAAEGNPIIGQWGEWPELSKADAELIRSAPEMLELLRYLISNNGPNCDWTGFSEACELVKRIDG